MEAEKCPPSQIGLTLFVIFEITPYCSHLGPDAHAMRDDDLYMKDNKLNKLLIIGKTGTGKSSLCNVICGKAHDDAAFPVSAEASTCTQEVKFAEEFFGGDESKRFNIIDTIGFDDPKNDSDAKIIADLVVRLRKNVDHINTFVIAVNGQNPRLDGALLSMIRILEGMFGEQMWMQTLVVFMWPASLD